MKRILFVAAAFLALGAFGCAAETASDDTSSSSSAESLKSAQVVGEFEHCGGFIGDPSVCAAGLKCKLDPIADLGGICVKKDVGNHCGGNTTHPHVCERGLECVLNVSVPDVGGTCQYAKAGESCGGNMTTALECGPKLACKQSNPDVGGICVKVSQKGEPCGGFMLGAPICATGLTCTPNHIPDLPGTCE